MLRGYSSMEVKNPIFTCEFVFRPAIIQYGLWNQLRTVHSQELLLCIFVEDLLKTYREITEKEPWMQTTSTQNNVMERFWPELNSRINYPIMRAMIDITVQYEYDMSDPVLKYCVSWFIILFVKMEYENYQDH